MKVFFDIDDINSINDQVGVTIGTFDGLHIGHKEVIETVVKKCKEDGLKSVVYTFSNIPKEVTTGGKVKNIITLDEKVRLISQLHVDYLILIEFNENHMNISAEKFIREILLNHLNVKHLVIGHDFRFGKKAQGNYELLLRLQNEFKYELDVIEPILVDGMRVSSTLIRELLSEGNIEEVNKFLGRRHYYRSIVMPGKKIGTEIGFPTANLKIDQSMHTLKPGVYITQVLSKNIRYNSITNIGFNPTFNQNELNFETFIFNFNGDLYEKEIVVEFISRIRDEMKFHSKEELIKWIENDVEKAKFVFNSLLK
ncbi:MAG: bifunctional riboflavin kinase/FAD synthetase [Clostridiales bacterium]|nr:bifunctional riboflavin kinase/FAD synthetase [Clostridiales bacterium]